MRYFFANTIIFFFIGILAGLTFLVPGYSFQYQAPPAADPPPPLYDIIRADVTKYVLRGTMANGEQVHLGAVACPRRIKLGTKVLIDGQEYICKDRLAKRYDDRFDIWEPDYDAAIQWGKQDKEVSIVF